VYQARIFNGKVIKSFMSPWSLKWLISLPTLVFYPYSINPKTRFFREVNFFTEWSKKKHPVIKVPKILGMDYSRLIIVREYIKGRTAYDIGLDGFLPLFEALAFIHNEGWVLGDTKPSNFLLDDKNHVFVIDAEQAIRSNNVEFMAWDLAILLLVTNVYATITGNLFDFEPHNILDEYLKINPNNSVARFAFRYFERMRPLKEVIRKYLAAEL